MKKVIFTIGIVCSMLSAVGQDIRFTQSYMSQLELNPANAGAEFATRATLNYRNQWKSVTTPYKSMMAAADLRLNFLASRRSPGYFAGGVFVYNDRGGDAMMNRFQVGFNGAYHLRVATHHTLGAGVQLGYFRRSVRLSQLSWETQYDGFYYDASMASGEAAVGKSYGAADVAVGINWTMGMNDARVAKNSRVRMAAGLSLHHINRPSLDHSNIVKDPLAMKWVFHSHGAVGIGNSRFFVMPSLLMMYQNEISEFALGSNVMYKLSEEASVTNNVDGNAVGLGVMYRYQDMVAVTGLLEFEQYTFGASYDFTISDLQRKTSKGGAFELSLRYRLSDNLRGRARMK